MDEVDVVVAGSGAAGMTAALTAAHLGLNALVIEKAGSFGGSTARSGGGCLEGGAGAGGAEADHNHVRLEVPVARHSGLHGGLHGGLLPQPTAKL